MALTIERIIIENFRSIEGIEIYPSEKAVFIGANNAGKTNILAALQLVLGPTGRSALNEPEDTDWPDWIPDAERRRPDSAMVVDLTFKFPSEDTALMAAFLDKCHVDGDHARFRMRYKYGYQPENEEFSPELEFVSCHSEDDEETIGLVSSKHRRYIPVFYVGADRNLGDEFRVTPRTFWGQMIDTVDLSSKADEIAERLKLTEDDLQGNEQLSLTAAQLRQTFSEVMGPIDEDAVEYSLGGVSQRDLVRSITINLRAYGSNDRLPLWHHGLGAQNLVMFAVFKAFLQLSDKNTDSPRWPILAIEEPEAHLHPHAQRSLARLISSIPGQVFVTTHSHYFTENAELESVMVVQRHYGKTICNQFRSELSRQDLGKLRKSITHDRSEFFFATAVILSEGDSERYTFPRFAEVLGHNFHQRNVSVVSVDGKKNFYPFLMLLKESNLGIPFIIQCDEDAYEEVINQLEEAGCISKKRARVWRDNPTKGRREMKKKGIFCIRGDFERQMIDNGWAKYYEKWLKENWGKDALRKWVRQKGMEDASLEDQVWGYMNTHKQLKAKVAWDIAQEEHIDARKIPKAFREVLAFASRTADMALGVSPDGTGSEPRPA